MRRLRPGLRFFGSCWSSSVIVGFPLVTRVEYKVSARHAPQDHAFEAVEVIQAVTRGFAGGPEQRLPRILAHHAQQGAESQSHHLAAALLGSSDGGGPIRPGLLDFLFFVMRSRAGDPLGPPR